MATKPTPSDLLESGQQLTRAMLRHWQERGRVIGDQIHAISSWGLGETSLLNKTTLSKLIGGTRSIDVKALLAFDAWNRVVHAWQTKGQDAAVEQFGPYQSWDVRPEWMDAAAWLPLPEDPAAPMELTDFLYVLVGRLPLPYLGSAGLLLSDNRHLSERLSQLLNQALVDSGRTPREAFRILLAGYPVTDTSRRERLRRLILEGETMTRDELREELFAIAEAIRTLKGLPVGSYGPEALQEELLRD
jgi:hypothetical protein